jgi:hypothetical protein
LAAIYYKHVAGIEMEAAEKILYIENSYGNIVVIQISGGI